MYKSKVDNSVTRDTSSPHKGRANKEASSVKVKRKCSCLFHRKPSSGLGYPSCANSSHCMGELTTNERMRQRLLHEVQSLRSPQTTAAWAGIKKVSMRRRSLEQANEALSDRLHDLTWLNQQQQSAISQYLSQLGQEQRLAAMLLANHATPHHLRKLPLEKWTNDDVTTWLNAVGMEKFSQTFTDHHICGRDLTKVDIQLLDKLGISSESDRELVLSRLYELQTSHQSPLATVPESPVDPDYKTDTRITPDLPHDADKEKDSSLQHNRPAVSDDEAKIAEDNRTSERKLTVWHDFTGRLKGAPVCVPYSATCQELIILVLADQRVSHDPQLFYLAEVTLDTSPDIVSWRELRDDELPWQVKRGWATSGGKRARLEIRRRPGIRVKVSHDLDDEISASQKLDLAHGSTCGQLLELALKAFDITTDERLSYSLSVLSNNSGPRVVDLQKPADFYESDSFHLSPFCQKAMDVMSRSSNKPLEGANCVKSPPRSSKYSAMSAMHKMNSLEDLVAELREGMQEKDQLIQKIQQENEESRDNKQQAGSMKKVMSKVNQAMLDKLDSLMCRYTQLCEDPVTDRGGPDSSAEEGVESLEQALVITGQQLQLVEQRETFLRSQLTETQSGPWCDELRGQLEDTEGCLLELKQQQADVYRRLKLAKKSLIRQRSLPEGGLTLFHLLQEIGHNPSVTHQLVATETASGPLPFSADHSGRPVLGSGDLPEGLLPGDRVLEVNGLRTTHMTAPQLTSLLPPEPGSRPAVVVLRSGVNYELRLRERTEETHSLREELGKVNRELSEANEDLSLAVIEMDSLQEENKELLSRTERLVSDRQRLQEANSVLEKQFKEARQNLTDSREQSDTQRTQLDTFRAQMGTQEAQLDKQKAQLEEIQASGSRDAEHQQLNKGILQSKDNVNRLSQQPTSPQARRVNSLRRTPSDMVGSRVRRRTSFLQAALGPDMEAGDVLSYEDLDLAPLWESLQMASKAEVLQALKDQVLESWQRKVYLDHLLTAVINHAPYLVQEVDETVGLLDPTDLALKDRTEEFC